MKRPVLALVSLAILCGPTRIPAARAEGADSAATRSVERSPATAVGLSIASTVVPLALAAVSAQSDRGHPRGATAATLAIGGIVAGPAAGYFYGDCPQRGWVGIGARAVLLGGGVALGYALQDPSTDVPTSLGWVMLGVVATTLEAGYDVAVLPDHVRRRHPPRSAEARLQPALLAGARGEPVPAVALRLEW